MAKNDSKEPKPLSAAASTKQARDAKREAIRAALAAERAACIQVANKVPPSFGEWGYVRTCAWEMVARKLRQIAKRTGASQQALDALKAARQMVEQIPTMDIDLCAKLVTPRKVTGAQKLAKTASMRA